MHILSSSAAFTVIELFVIPRVDIDVNVVFSSFNHNLRERLTAFTALAQQPWLSRAQYTQRESSFVLKRLNSRFDFQDRIADGGEAVVLVGVCKEFGLDDACPVGEREKFHRLTGDLMMRALFNYEAARRDGFADEFAETVHRAIRVPRHVIKQFERVAADGESEQVGFPFQTFAMRRLVQWKLW